MEKEITSRLRQQPRGIKRIALFGPESTGKTTLARQLAEVFDTEWVPEYMREYLQKKWDEQGQTCAPSDLLPIALGQMESENRLAARARKVLFTDTNLLELAVYSQVYYGYVSSWLEEAASQAHYDLYFLTYIDVPWEPDDLRDKPDERDEMFRIFEKALQERGLPYIVLKGDKPTRLQKARKIVQAMIDYEKWLTPADLALLDRRGTDPADIINQIHWIRQGGKFVKLDRPAVPGDGIQILDEAARRHYETYFNDRMGEVSVKKFVPASGAATRMFRDCHKVNEFFRWNPEAHWDEMIDETYTEKCRDFDNWKHRLPFFEEVMAKIRAHVPVYDQWDTDRQNRIFVRFLLGEQGLHYARMPKALVIFHRYDDAKRTAFEEHLVEAEQLGTEVEFTVNPEREELFRREEQQVAGRYGVPVSYSYQDPSTDTIMLDAEGMPVRDAEGHLVFRPGGHGSLLKNLQEAGADLLLVKNVDNVQRDEFKADTLQWQRILGGMVLDLRDRIHGLLHRLDQNPTGEELQEIVDTVRHQLHIPLIEGFDTLPASHKRRYLHFKLNRPIRVAGMVVNTGAPGGGPFWAYDHEGNISLQIIEKAQIDTADPRQKAIMDRSTHFNPVLMALWLKDYKGRPFDLNEFVNRETGFVTEKTLDGKEVKVYEHPGLWNGSMWHWLTWFVEVPETTFSPVKEFYDLLQVPHVLPDEPAEEAGQTGDGEV